MPLKNFLISSRFLILFTTIVNIHFSNNTKVLSLQNKNYTNSEITKVSIAELEKLALNYYKNAKNYFRIGDKQKAISYLQKAIPIFLKTQNSDKYILSQIFLAQLYISTGNPTSAEPLLQTAIELAQKKEISLYLALGKEILGDLYLTYKQYNTAIEHYEESLKINKNTSILIKLSQVYREKAQAYEKSFLLLDDIGIEKEKEIKNIIEQDFNKGYDLGISAINFSKNPQESIISKLNILKDYKSFLSQEKFTQYKFDIIGDISPLENSSFKASSLITLAQILNNKEGLTILSEAIEIAGVIEDRRNLAEARQRAGEIYLNSNQLDDAKEKTEQAILMSLEIGSPQMLFYQLQQLGKVELLLGNKSEGMRAYSSALFNLRSPRSEFGIGNNFLFYLQEEAKPFLREYIELLLKENQPERAIEVLSTLKLSEFQAYFNDPCIEIAIEKNPNLQLENDSATRIYTFVTPDRTYLIVNNPGRPIKLHTIDISETELNRIAFEYLEEIYEPYRWNYKDKARPLYDLLIAPIMSDLAGVEQITFIQDGILRNMPMESLFDGERYLIQDYTIDYASGLAGRPQVLRKRERSFIAGSTIFPNTGFTELPFVEAELKFLKQKLPNHTLLENEEFTIAEVERLLASSRYDRLHFATHGFFGGNADNSFILAYDGKIDILKFNSLFASLDVPPSLLFLSGCETAKGNSQAPLGITGTAIRGGTSNVIATMWAIQDSIAVEFVKDFYTFLDEGKSIAEAKRAAQLNLVELHPTIWASFMAFKI